MCPRFPEAESAHPYNSLSPVLTVDIVVRRHLLLVAGKLVAAQAAPEGAKPAHATAKPAARGLVTRAPRPGKLAVQQVAEDEGEGGIAAGHGGGGGGATAAGVGFTITSPSDLQRAPHQMSHSCLDSTLSQLLAGPNSANLEQSTNGSGEKPIPRWSCRRQVSG